MQTLRDYALSFIGTEYKWAGGNPLTGFDCSGFVGELLKSVGLLHYNEKLSSQEIYNRLENLSTQNSRALGSIAFFGESVTKISHVAFMLDQYRIIEAGGGDHTTLDLKTASDQNAFVKIRLLSYRTNLVAVLKPRYATIGMI